MKEKIDLLAKEIESELIKIRRHIHENPELSLKEKNTSDFIVSKLKEFGITEIYNDIYETTVIAIIRGKGEGKTVLVRADMDALPITEMTECEYKSKNPGVMHACGHDAHVSWILGAAYILNKIKDNFNGNIKILFQPAEEGGGGADVMLDTRDILNEEPSVDYALAAHVWPELDINKIGIVNGCAMAAANKFILNITGKGGHGAEPHKTIDPISLANQIYMCAQQIISRKISPFENAVLTIGKFIGDGAFNVIPNSVLIEGTIRAESYSKVKEITNEFEKVINGIVNANGANYSLEIEKPIHAVINDTVLIKFAKSKLKGIYGEDLKILRHGAMTGEDFCYISRKVPSLFMYVGSKVEGDNSTYGPLHSPYLNINEKIIPQTSSLISYLAIEILNNKEDNMQ